MNADAHRLSPETNPVLASPWTVFTGGCREPDPAIACGPVEGAAMVAYQSGTGKANGVDYGGKNRIWAQLAGDLQPSAGDAGTVSIVRPAASFTMPSWHILPKVRIENYGSVLRSFKATFTIDPGGWSSTRTVLRLRAGEARAVEFAPFPLSTGLFTSTCQALLTDEGDETCGNDSKPAILQGCGFIDFSGKDNSFLVAVPDTGWARGEPRSPWTRPPMETMAWGERLNAYYGNTERATLTSPTYTATQVNPATAFQHSFSTEAGYDDSDSSCSTDDGSTWDVLTPDAGLRYYGDISSLTEPGWSGCPVGGPSGWQQSVFTIPMDEPTPFKVRRRF